MSTENKNMQSDDELQNEISQPGKDQVQNTGSESDASGSHGHADMTTRPSEGAVGSTHSSGISTKRSVTGSDFDGQVSSS